MVDHRSLPLRGILALSTTAFLIILTETMPAAVLPEMAKGLHRSTPAIGILVSVYALASAAAAIPIVALTQAIPRRRLYVFLLLSFAFLNAITALSQSYALTIASRLGAGLTAGVAWPVVVGFAIRLGQGSNVGRAVAISLAGSTVAMVAGLPIGSLLGSVFGWRVTFALLSAMAMVVTIWVLTAIPPAPAERQHDAVSVWSVARIPGLGLILLATLFGIAAHYTLYTYIAPLATSVHLPGSTAEGLLLFGGGALVGIMLVGRYIDRYRRLLPILAPTLAIVAWLILLLGQSISLSQAAILLWGISFGGLPTIVQSAVARVAQGPEAELATAMLTTVYNVGIFAGGAAGGLLLTYAGLSTLMLVATITIAAALGTIVKGCATAFPK